MAIQRSNSLLPLAIRTAQPFSAFQESETRGKRNDLLDAQTARVDQSTELGKSQIKDAEQLREFTSVATGAVGLKRFLDAGDLDGAERFLLERRKNIPGGSNGTADTDGAIASVQLAKGGDQNALEKLNSQIDEAILGAQQLGILKKIQPDLPSDVRSFTEFEKLGDPDNPNELSPAQQRFIQVKRGTTQVVDIAGAPNIVDRTSGAVTPLSTSQQEVTAAANDAAAVRDAQNQSDISSTGNKVATAGQAKRDQDNINAGFVAADSLPILNRGLELLDLIGTGKPAEIALAFKNAFGITGADEGELSANLGKAVLSQLRSTFGAQFTEKEGDRLAAIEAGFGKSTPTNKRLLGQAKRLVERTVKRGAKSARDIDDEELALEIEAAANFSLAPETFSDGTTVKFN